MKRLLLVLMVIACAPAAFADGFEYNYLAFTNSNGVSQTVSVTDLTITFADGKLVAVNGDGTKQFLLTDLTKMYFTDTPTGISEVTVDGSTSQVEVYSVAGVFIGNYPTLAAAKSKLKAGMYVIKQKDKTTKIAIR